MRGCDPDEVAAQHEDQTAGRKRRGSAVAHGRLGVRGRCHACGFRTERSDCPTRSLNPKRDVVKNQHAARAWFFGDRPLSPREGKNAFKPAKSLPSGDASYPDDSPLSGSPHRKLLEFTPTPRRAAPPVVFLKASA
jgi:hypothetical protein